MNCTSIQKRHFLEHGYIKVPGAVPKLMIDNALRSINHSLGSKGMNEADLPILRAQTYCREVRETREITGLFNATPLYALAESLLGEGKVVKAKSGQLALRFPQAHDAEYHPPMGHLDGIGSGSNGHDVGTYTRGFTALVTILLSDLPESDSGNFTVWPGTHRLLESHLREHGTDVLKKGRPQLDWQTDPVQITGKAGDAVISHHQLIHAAAMNYSPHIRYAAIFRIRHVYAGDIGNEAFTDIWREWEGLQEAMMA